MGLIVSMALALPHPPGLIQVPPEINVPIFKDVQFPAYLVLEMMWKSKWVSTPVLMSFREEHTEAV